MELGPGLWAHCRLEEPSRKEGTKLTQTAEHRQPFPQAALVVTISHFR